MDIPSRTKNIRVWVPIPLAKDHQKLLSFQVLGQRPYKVAEEPEYGNRFIVLNLTKCHLLDSDTAEISIKFDVSRYAISPLHKHQAAEQAVQYQSARHLSPAHLIPIDGKIAKEAYQTAGYLQNPLKQAKLLYDHIVETVTYDKSGTGWGRGDAIYTCDVRKGNCTDFHSLFIGQARALHIPARFIMGLPLPEDRIEGNIPGYHCWGEFYLPEKGWLPIDASEASKFPEKKEMFFARLNEHRVAFTIGRDIKLPGSEAEPLNYVIYPHVEIDGQTHTDVQTNFYFRDY